MAKEITIDIHNGITEHEVSDDLYPLHTDLFTNELNLLRDKRNNLLSQSDWTQISDVALTDAKKIEWATYRQQLRDLPASLTTNDDIDNLVWPTQPE